jgi:hypothetical protein
MTTESRLQALDASQARLDSRHRVGQFQRWRNRLREDIQTVYDKDPAARGLIPWPVEAEACYGFADGFPPEPLLDGH